MLKGHCNCENVAFEAELENETVIMCHCTICQRASGVQGVAVLIVDKATFRWLRGKEFIANWSKPGADWQSWFCRNCGSPLPGKNDDSRMYIPAGTVSSGAERCEVSHHIWVESKPDWFVICDSGKLHDQNYS